MPIFRYIRRRWIIRRPFPDGWRDVLRERVPVYRRLPDPLREKLHRRIRVLLDEKRFEGCGGLTVTEEMRLVIAALAGMLILEEPSDYFPNLTSILVYPEDYMGRFRREDAAGVVTEGWESRSGESWNPGNIVLSWSDIRSDLRNPSGGRNLVYHEFAHQLDYRYGLSAGIDEKGRTGDGEEDEWTLILARVYRGLRRKARRGNPGVLDHYGAVKPAECFAVVTEAFMLNPHPLQRQYPDLYSQLETFYGFDPAAFAPEPGAGRER